MSLLFLINSAIALSIAPKGPTTSHPAKNLVIENPAPSLPNSRSSIGYCSVLHDDFSSGQIDPKIWRHDVDLSGMGNWEFEMYNDYPENSFVKDSILYLKPTLTPDEIVTSGTIDFGAKCTSNFPNGCNKTANGRNIINPITSAKLTTVNSVSINRGKIEVVAKLPAGDWLWPAIWLLPRDFKYGQWPRSGEIDIMESHGNKNTEGIEGTDQFGSTLHWGPTFPLNSWNKTHSTKPKGSIDYSQDFHTYGLVWTKDEIITYVDDPANIVLRTPTVDFFKLGDFPEGTENPWTSGTSAAPFDQEFYLILNLAVGGTASFFPDCPAKPWTNDSPHAAFDFYGAKEKWFPTWSSPTDPNSSALAIKSVKMWKEC